MRTDEQIEAMYLDWFNNFATTTAFCENYNLEMAECENILDRGRQLNHARK